MRIAHTQISGGRICWRQWGTGKSLLLCLHGFGDTGAQFEALAKALSPHFSVIAPDLPWHGATEWEKESFDAGDVQEMVETLLAKSGQERCVLLGHSWGGRISLASLPQLESRVGAAYLVAPGGFDAGSKWGGEKMPHFIRTSLIDSVSKNTLRWIKGAEHLAAAKILSPSVLRFFQSSLETRKRRDRLLAVWRNLHHFPVRRAPLLTMRMPLVFIVGDKDKLVSADAVYRFSKRLPQARCIRLPESGHRPDAAVLADAILNTYTM
ncbi:MAG: alpha/beta hydrolase [Saprospiraceae bacterium]|nr:alpha/beta hydrolase [Saprospiraceae bacterium]